MSESLYDLSGHLSEYVCDQLANTWGTFDLGGEQFRMGSSEDAEGLGWDDDDRELLIRRESDGALFEVTLDAKVTPAQPRLPEPPHDENHYRYHTPNQPLAGCAWCQHVGWAPRVSP